MNGWIFRSVTWSHIIELSKVKDIKLFEYYLTEIDNKKLTKLELREYIKSKSYERTIANQREGQIKHPIEKNLKDPIPVGKSKKKSEKELEEEIIINIFEFMKEIGNRVMLYGRQYKLRVNDLTYKIDIVLYDKENRNFILIDLKINKVTQKDISQMKFYVDCFNKQEKDKADNSTIGLILCETKDIRLEVRDDIYQIKYLNEMPKEDELLKIINENKIILLKTEGLNK